MLFKLSKDSSSPAGTKREKMQLDSFPQLSLFFTDLVIPDPEDLGTAHVVVTYKPPNEHPKTLEVPLRPDVSDLAQVEILLHKSGTLAYDMGPSYNKWFASCFGFDVQLTYLGPHLRDVLCSTPASIQSGSSWLSYITTSIPLLGVGSRSRHQITFADCVPYLVVSETSVKDVSNRLPEGEEMDVIKFRPNIVIRGAPEAWEEDFWAELQIGDSKIIAAHNCARCTSINVDYATGKFGTGESGSVLKKLMKDRRVDAGMKYNPIFGRYSFLRESDHGNIIKVGDKVTVLRRNAERTRFGE
jgi:uncharacterized protein YcbX